jgi:hypothetical protein
MWAITNDTPYKTGKSWGRDKDGVHEWIVAVKATYDIAPDGRVELASQQVEPLLIPEYHGEYGQSSLRYDADLVGAKPTTDVVLNGTAYAPGGRPTTDFFVRLSVGPISKTLRVRGTRWWDEGLFGSSRSALQPVTQVPVLYERAYGGYDHADPDPRNHRMDPRNPVGCGVAATPRHRVGQAVPNFEHPDGHIDKAGPAGFGAIDSWWSPRREFAGTYDEAWQQQRLPLLPEDWDRRSLLCAPADQRPANHLRGGEVVELVNLTADGLLRFVLPKVHLTFTTRIDGRVEEHRSRLSSVILEPDYPRVLMVWSTSLSCRNDADYLEETIVREKRWLSS